MVFLACRLSGESRRNWESRYRSKGIKSALEPIVDGASSTRKRLLKTGEALKPHKTSFLSKKEPLKCTRFTLNDKHFLSKVCLDYILVYGVIDYGREYSVFRCGSSKACSTNIMNGRWVLQTRSMKKRSRA